MIYYQDNFLPQEQFEALAKRVQGRFGTGDTRSLVEDSDEPVRLTYHDHTGNWREGCNFLGHECIPAIEKIIATMEENNIENIKNWSVWFQYIIDTMTLPPHQDTGLRKSDQANTYTAVIYTSDWKPNWGGEFVVGKPVFDRPGGNVKSLTNFTHTIEPKPNRMTIWSREEWHMVNALTVNDPDYVRSFMGTSWSSVENSEYENNPYQRFYFTER